jgi:hypothetical protein
MKTNHFEMRNHVPTVPTAPTNILTLYKSISYIEISSIKWEESVGNGRNTLEQNFIVLPWLEQKAIHMTKFPKVGAVGTVGAKCISLKIIRR